MLDSGKVPMKSIFLQFSGSNRGFIRKALVLLLAVVAGFAFMAVRGLQTVRWGMAECLRWQADSLSERFIIAEVSHQEMTAMVQEFSRKIESGSISPLRGFSVLRGFYKGPFVLALLYYSFVQRLRDSEMPEDSDLANLEKTSRLFFVNARLGKINSAGQSEIHKLLMEEKIVDSPTALGLTIPEQVETFRKKMGQGAIFDCLKRMAELCSTTEALSETAEVDMTAELKQILATAER